MTFVLNRVYLNNNYYNMPEKINLETSSISDLKAFAFDLEQEIKRMSTDYNTVIKVIEQRIINDRKLKNKVEMTPTSEETKIDTQPTA